MTSNYLILKKWFRETDSFNIISYFSVALNVEFNIIHILKFIPSTIQVFFFLKIYFLCSHNEGKTQSRFIAKRQRRDNFGLK